MPTPQRVLVVDDDEAVRASMSESLTLVHREVRTADGATAALAMFSSWCPDVMICDVRMPGLDGLELLEMVTERLPAVDVLMMTAYDDMSTVAGAMRRGAIEFLSKPVDLHELRSVIDRIFSDRATRRRSATSDTQLRDTPDTLVGRDARMIETFKLIGQAAGVRSNVLIRGESGTGKELVARAIHSNAANAAEPFVPVNCAAIPATLLESELFGHVRGAFTGATSDRRGRFAAAGKGTIFLDEIGDTSSDFQSKLLRVLQDREFQPVGSERTERTEARVIAATHRPLESMVDAKLFREDLYYRLRVIEIVLPPLRERPGDIPVLARHLVERACRMMDASPATLDDDAVALLSAHTWPGNVRELENCLVRAAVLARGGVIRPEHLNLSSPGNSHETDFASLSVAERDHIARVYSATGRNKSRTADILRVSRPRLDRLLRRHEL